MHRIKLRGLIAALIGLVFAVFFTSISFAQSSQRISEIKILGNKKIEEAAVRNKLLTKEGQYLDRETLRTDVQSLFDMGYFYNIQVDQNSTAKGLSLSFILTEKPVVGEIVYEGNEELDDDELNEAAALKPFEILNVTQIQDAAEKIQKLYEDKGFFLARVDYRLEDIVIETNEAKRIIFVVRENDKVEVKKITFLGNENLKAGYLMSRMQTKEGGFFSFMSGGGAYKQEIFDQDMRILNFLYFNEGYVQVKIDRPEVYVTPDKKSVYITIRISEGEKFDVGNVDFAGDLLFDEKELFDTIEMDEGGTFVSEKLQKDIRALTAKYGDLGYAFANVIPRTKIKQKERLVDITFEFDKGHKVYFGQINVVGNSKTRDKVVRRELRISEGELYNETKKRESVANVRRLGFFEEVNFNTSTPPDQPDRLDVEIVVKERNTGTIQVGAGFSSFSGFIFNGQVNQTNFLGKGQRLGVSLNLSKNDSAFNLSFTEPYFLDTNWLLGFDAFKTRRNFQDFEETKTGGAIRLGHPLAEHLRGVIRYKIDDTNLVLDNQQNADIFPVDTVNGITSSMTFTLEFDERNDRFSPSKGIFSSASLEYAGLGGDLKYTKLLTTFRYFKKLFWSVVWRNNLSYGLIKSNNANDPPFNELFRLGGANSLRGYDFFSVGKRKFSTSLNDDRVFGGTQQIFLQTELEFPLIPEAGIKSVVFFDVGQAEDDFVFREMRSDVGFGFRWFSPIGPLRFEWGFPIARREDDGAVNFQFAIGSPF